MVKTINKTKSNNIVTMHYAYTISANKLPNKSTARMGILFIGCTYTQQNSAHHKSGVKYTMLESHSTVSNLKWGEMPSIIEILEYTILIRKLRRYKITKC